MLRLHFVMGAILAFLMITPSTEAQQCKELDSATPDEWVSYLNYVTRNDQSTECIYFALRELRLMRWQPATDTLVKFLDFQRPPNAWEKEGMSRLEGSYPAADALASLGPRALPKVLSVMESGSASELSRHNAMVVWMRVYRGDLPKRVSMLAKEIEKAPTDVAKQRLMEAVADAVKYCTPDDKAKCKAASETRKETAQ
jgi:hypothetical protein